MAPPLPAPPNAAIRPYASPALTSLGSIAGRTAGQASGSLDCLLGTPPGPGGFGGQPTPDECTS